MLLFKNWRSQRVPCIHAGATKTTLERSARMDSWVVAAVQNKWTTTVRLIMDRLWICNSPQSLVLYQELNTVLSNLSNQFNHVSTGAVIMGNSKIYKITSACYTALPRPELHRGSPWDYNLYRFLRDQPHPLQLVWEQAVTSQASWGLEVLFGFRGGARRGGVSWKLSCCWKTGTFPHESQTLFSLSFTRGKKRPCRWRKGHGNLELRPLEGSSQLHSKGEASGRHPEHQSGSTASVSSAVRKIGAGFGHTCLKIRKKDVGMPSV